MGTADSRGIRSVVANGYEAGQRLLLADLRIKGILLCCWIQHSVVFFVCGYFSFKLLGECNTVEALE